MYMNLTECPCIFYFAGLMEETTVEGKMWKTTMKCSRHVFKYNTVKGIVGSDVSSGGSRIFKRGGGGGKFRS